MAVNDIGIIWLFLLIIFILILNILITPYLCEFSKSDVIIILGCNLNSIFMKERLTKTIELYKSNKANYIIVTGRGKEKISEALGMKRKLIHLGIEESHILIEDKAQSTYENLIFSKDIMKFHGFNDCIIVSDGYHFARIRMICKIIKLNAGFAPSKKCYFNKYGFSAMLRETIAYIKDFIVCRLK